MNNQLRSNNSEWEQWKKEYEEGSYEECDWNEEGEFDLEFDGESDEGYDYYNERERDT